MQPLKHLTKPERAKLLHQLFPQIIPDILTYSTEFVEKILTNDKYFKEWEKDEDLYHLPTMRTIAFDVKNRLTQDRESLENISNYFGYYLFDGLNHYIMEKCITYFLNEVELADNKFNDAYDLLFN